VAQNSFTTAGENRGHPAAFLVETAMAHGIDPDVHPVPRPALDPLLNRSRPDPQEDQLAPAHHAVLSSGQLPSHPVYVTRDAFAPDGVVNASLVSHDVDAEGPQRACGARKRAFSRRKRGSSPPVPPLALIP
jgi:hypothetical protein